MGFSDAERTLEKPENTYRIAALGGSTTEQGYPQMLEGILDSLWQNDEDVEVLNFGVASWTTAHSLINFMLNAVEYDPDMIIIHHGWNDAACRDVPDSTFRSDYSHVFKYWHEPEIFDAPLTRYSLIYRRIKEKRGVSEAWLYLDRNTVHRDRIREETNFTDLSELAPYRRNVKAMIDHALINNIEVVLTTMPYTTDQSAELSYQQPQIKQCNAIDRELILEYQDRIAFADVDSAMTGKHNGRFKDLAHLDRDGNYLKAKFIAASILNYVFAQGEIKE